MSLNNDYLKSIKAWLIIFIPGFFYVIQTALSVSAVLVVRFQHDFSINYFQVSLFESLYIICYIAMQIPAGLLLDKFSTNRLIAMAILVYSAALMLLSFTQVYSIALVCWILMGASSSFSFLRALKIAARRLSSHQYPLAVGLLETIMAVSAIFSMYLFHYVNHGDSWRKLFLQIAFILAPFALLAFMFARTTKLKIEQAVPSYTKSLSTIFSNKRLWILVLYIGFISVSLVVLTNNWQVDMLKNLYHIKDVEAVTINAMAMFGYIMGALHGGLYRTRFGARKTLITTAFVKLVVLIGGIYAASQALLSILLFANGFAIGLSLLCFTIAKEWVPSDQQSLAAALVNMSSDGVGAIVLPISSFLLDTTQQNFYLAVIPLYIANFIVIAVSFMIRERR